MNRPNPTPRRHSARARGFTLIELVVAVSLTLMMMILIGQVFDQSRRAIGRGTATGDVIGNSKALSSHLAMDFDAMLGPTDNERAPTGATAQPGDASGGYLVIVQRSIGDWDNDKTFDGDTNGDGRLTPDEGDVSSDAITTEGVLFQLQNAQLERRFVRSDQISFIAARGDGQQPIVAGDTDRFVPHNDGGAAKQLRVWYGHLSRLNRDGSEVETVGATSPDNPLNPGHLGRPGADRYGNRFIIGRQALFLGEAEDTTATPPKTHPAIIVDDNTEGIGPLADVDGLGTAANPAHLYRGLSDYANFSFDNPGTTGNTPRVVGEAGTGIAPILAADVAFSDPDYHLAALGYLTFSNKRLRVNPQPDAATWESWRLAQMHPYLMEYASDFAVEFAGDYFTGNSDHTDSTYAPDGTVDTGEAFNIPGSGAPDGYGYDSFGNLAKDLPDGHIKWYTAPHLANHPALMSATVKYDATKPVTYPWPWATAAYNAINPSGVYNPFYLRPNTGSDFVHADVAFVFRHDDENGKFTNDPDQSSLWPYLLRIRYRLHDPRGELMSGLGQHGVWFEQIVPVRRPAR